MQEVSSSRSLPVQSCGMLVTDLCHFLDLPEDRTRPVPHVAWRSTWATLSGRPLIERPFVVTPKGTRLARLIDAVREIL